VCEITYALREERDRHQLIVVNAGSGVQTTAPDVCTGSIIGPATRSRFDRIHSSSRNIPLG
jgi:methyl coenzyme M reductase subunit C